MYFYLKLRVFLGVYIRPNCKILYCKKRGDCYHKIRKIKHRHHLVYEKEIKMFVNDSILGISFSGIFLDLNNKNRFLMILGGMAYQYQLIVPG